MRVALLTSFLAVALATTSLATPASISSLDEVPGLMSGSLVARGTKSNGKSCTQSIQCNSGYCRRGTCDVKKPDGHVCYKDQGCVSGICNQGKCLSSKARPNGVSCSESSQCKSGYCGFSTCRKKLAVGQACYKNVGCLSNNCGNTYSCRPAKDETTTTVTASSTGTSTATSTATSTSTSTSSAPSSTATCDQYSNTKRGTECINEVVPVANNNIADFSDGTLGTWSADPAAKVSVVADANSPGGHVAQFTLDNNAATSLERTDLTDVEATSDAPSRRSLYYHLEAHFEYRFTAYQYTGEQEAKAGSGCYMNLYVNGRNTGGNTIGTTADTPDDLNSWRKTSNGVGQNSNTWTSLKYGVTCSEGVTATVDFRNITRTSTYLGSD